MYKSKFVRKTRMVNGIEVKCKPLTKTAVRRISSNISELLSEPPSPMRNQAISNNRQRLREMGARPWNFEIDELRGWLDAYLSDDLERFEAELLRQRMRFPLFESVFRI